MDRVEKSHKENTSIKRIETFSSLFGIPLRLGHKENTSIKRIETMLQFDFSEAEGGKSQREHLNKED